MIVKLISFIKIERKQEKNIQQQLKIVPEVAKILMISGEADILVEIHAKNSEELVEIIEKIEDIIGIKEIHSHFVMDEWKK